MGNGLARAIVSMMSIVVVVSLSGTATVRAETVTIRITDTLDPASATVAPGTSIRFENADGERHRMRTTSGPAEFDTGNLDPGGSATVVLNAVGTYRYLDERDDENPAYVGVIVVSTSPPTTAPGTPPTTSPPAPSAVTVSIGDRRYTPATVTVAPGGMVTWVNDDDRPHTVTADDRSFDSGIMNTGDTWSRVFPEGGTFTYFCDLHPDMRGTVSVVVAGSTPATPPPTPPPPTTAPPAPTPPPPAPPAPTPGEPAPASGTVAISGNRFTPATITVVAGGSITWTNHDAVPHTVTATDGSFDSGILRQGDQWSRAFPTVGTFRYFCELHPEMTATVVVVPPGTPLPPSASPTPTSPASPTTSPPRPSASPSSPSPSASPGQSIAATATVSITGNAYQPQVVTIAVGGSVTWTNLDQVPHTVTADDRSFDSGILFTGDVWTMSFTRAGTYRYFCELHPEMTATVVVTTPGASPPPVVTGAPPTGTGATSGVSTGAGGSSTAGPGASPGGRATAASGSPAPGAAAVTMADNRFHPDPVTIGVGGTVTWTNTDTLPHTVTAADGSFDSGIMMPGDVFSWRFDAVGAVSYRCTLHPGMTGTVDVVEVAAGGPAVAGAPLQASRSDDGTAASSGAAAVTPTGGADDDVVIRITESEFPAVVTLTPGRTVTWVNEDDRSVDVVADDGSFDSGELVPGERFSTTFAAEGAVSYRSALRDRMEGMIVVVPDGEGDEPVPTVAVYDAWFAPRDLMVHEGATVRWAFGGVLPHTVTSDDGSFDSGILEPGAIFTMTFDELGTYSYSCLVHPAMTGSVTVVAVGEEIPASRSGISAFDAGDDESATSTAPSAPTARNESAGPIVLLVLLLIGLGIGVALGILVGVEKSAARRRGALAAG